MTPRILCQLRGLETSSDPLLSLPVFTPAPEPGILQVWTGLIAVTPPEWSLLVRGVPNAPGNLVYEVMEGIVETGWWHGPLVGNLRFRKTDQVVHLRPDVPLFGLQPVPCEAYRDEELKRTDFSPPRGDLTRTRRLVSEAMRIRTPDNPGGYRRAVLSRRRQERVDGTGETVRSLSTGCPVMQEASTPGSYEPEQPG
ncbi:DUF6065 family protein [Streptomyces caelestis]|uniref:DUF6065 family protein n=1 Tax=Streptomyces caelestis TaxID=36816 RepID=UPI00364E1AF2